MNRFGPPSGTHFQLTHLTEGLSTERLVEFEARVREFGEQLEPAERRVAFLAQLDVFRASMGELDEALRELQKRMRGRKQEL